MRILSVNVGDSRPVTVKQRTIQSGIYKVPVSGPVNVSRMGLQDDVRIEERKMGLENSAVYAYPYEHYAYWQRELNRDEPFPIGQFGENLTVTGLLEEEVRIGDIFRFGNTVLQVAHPRIPCGKLNARMGLRFAPMFLASCKVGYYMRVLEEGTISEGDSIELLERDENSPTMEEFVRVTHYEYWDTVALKQLLQARDLMPAWRETIEAKLVRSQAAKGWHGVRVLKVVNTIKESDDTVSLELDCFRGRELPSFHGGQQLMVALGERGGGSQQRRSYFLSGQPQKPSTYRITVQSTISSKEVAGDGDISSFLQSLKKGDQFQCNAPHGAVRSLPEETPEDRNRVLISQGVGIAPILSLLYELEERQTQVILFHESTENEPQGLLKEWHELIARNANYKLINIDSDIVTAEQVNQHVTLIESDIDVSGSRSFIERLELEFMALNFSPAALITYKMD